jgi:hypothetical protein
MGQGDHKARLKESIGLSKILNGVENFYKDDFWLDLTNGAALALNVEDLETFKKALVNSIRYMDKQKKNQK